MIIEGKSADVTTDLYRAHFELLAPDLLYMKRRLTRAVARHETDVFANRWQFFRARLRRDQVYVRSGKSFITVDGPVALFVPPFSIVEWSVSPGEIEFECYQSSVELPPSAPREPYLMQPRDWRPLRSLEEMLALLRVTPVQRTLTFEQTNSPLARRTKRLIDASYRQPASLATVASNLTSLPPTVSRAFRSCYGISPVEYRGRLRVDEAAKLIQTRGIAVKKAAKEVGFHSLNRFYAQFRRVHSVRPSQFKLDGGAGAASAVSSEVGEWPAPERA